MDSQGNPLPAVNNGSYAASTQIVSLGVTIAWDEVVKSTRVIRFRSDDELDTPSRPATPPPDEPEEGDERDEPASTEEPAPQSMQITPEEVAALEAERAPARQKSSRKAAKKRRSSRRADRRRHAAG